MLDHMGEGNPDHESIKWFNKFSRALQRYIMGTPASSAEKVKVAWQNMPPGLQEDIAAAARFDGCDCDLAAVVGELPEPQPKITKDPMFLD